ncbi:1,4-dihydroxy-2-naphthoate octaprenyltransferase [Persicirhabdus sediminis]|uniref:1,4-dihydroxy-2-naphthoate octaprenyltransferase n=1 Tax=Persicirhabdus sediminis TaxID=454144 RepID=A0A8J7MAU3_9BACT|nr:1,4-dihydroxy-2-naphthoate octaprenyltransferase [Persicirhabdus sediminis]MBK1789638.1 1,4-dihydroxy-2-naphthoate octaprenyltransferase [Persicirhabdus sediminis]
MNLKSVILAARPKTLPAAVVPVWLGCLLSSRVFGQLDLWLAFCTLMGAIWIQIATNFFNDAIDDEKGADTEARIGPTRATASGLMTRKQVYSWAFACLGIAALCGIPMIMERGPIMLAIGLPSFYLAYGYTGGPLPLAYRGLGELFVILFFGLVAVMGTVFVQLGEWPWQAAVLGLQLGFLSALLISINNLRDAEEDAGNDKRTLAVRWGRKPVLLSLLAMFITPYLLLAFLPGLSLQLLWFLIPFALGAKVIVSVCTTPASPVYNKYLGMAGVHLILFASVCTWVY